MAVQSKHTSDSLEDLRTSPPRIESPYQPASRGRHYVLDSEPNNSRHARSYQTSCRSVSASVYPHKSRSPASVAATEHRYQYPATARVPTNRHQSNVPAPSRGGNRPRSVISISSDDPDLRDEIQALDQKNRHLQGQIDSLTYAISLYNIYIAYSILAMHTRSFLMALVRRSTRSAPTFKIWSTTSQVIVPGSPTKPIPLASHSN